MNASSKRDETRETARKPAGKRGTEKERETGRQLDQCEGELLGKHTGLAGRKKEGVQPCSGVTRSRRQLSFSQLRPSPLITPAFHCPFQSN